MLHFLLIFFIAHRAISLKNASYIRGTLVSVCRLQSVWPLNIVSESLALRASFEPAKKDPLGASVNTRSRARCCAFLITTSTYRFRPTGENFSNEFQEHHNRCVQSKCRAQSTKRRSSQ